MKIEVIPQQDAITVEFEGDYVSISQPNSDNGTQDTVAVTGKANVAALITALQQVLETME